MDFYFGHWPQDGSVYAIDGMLPGWRLFRKTPQTPCIRNHMHTYKRAQNSLFAVTVIMKSAFKTDTKARTSAFFYRTTKIDAQRSKVLWMHMYLFKVHVLHLLANNRLWSNNSNRRREKRNFGECGKRSWRCCCVRPTSRHTFAAPQSQPLIVVSLPIPMCVHKVYRNKIHVLFSFGRERWKPNIHTHIGCCIGRISQFGVLETKKRLSICLFTFGHLTLHTSRSHLSVVFVVQNSSYSFWVFFFYKSLSLSIFLFPRLFFQYFYYSVTQSVRISAE